MLPFKLLIALFLAAVLQLMSLGGCYHRQPMIEGEIRPKKSGDTLFLEYDLKVIDTGSDSVKISPPVQLPNPDSLIYRADSSSLYTDNRQQFSDGSFRF